VIREGDISLPRLRFSARLRRARCFSSQPHTHGHRTAVCGHSTRFGVSLFPNSEGSIAVTRKGELSHARLRRDWPHHVAISAVKVRGPKNYDLVHGFADARVAPRTFSMRRNDLDFVVICFAKQEDADAFRERFNGERVDSRG